MFKKASKCKYRKHEKEIYKTCKGKRIFYSKGSIKEYIQTHNNKLEPYKCGFCNNYHLTTNYKYFIKKIRREWRQENNCFILPTEYRKFKGVK